MTVSTSTNSVVYRGNGATTQFAVPFKVIDEDHLQVRRRLLSTGAYEHTYVGTDYSYVGLGTSTGTLTLAGSALSSDFELVIERLVPYTQDLDIVNAGGFYPETVEEQLDLIVMSVQQLADLAGRGITVPIGEVGMEFGSEADRAGKYFSFDALGQFFPSAGTGSDSALRTDLAEPGGSALTGFSQGSAGAEDRSVESKLMDLVNLADFGSDVQALKDAIDHISVAGGGLLEIPPGAYSFASADLVTPAVLPSDIIVRGYGAVITITGVTEIASLFSATDESNILLEGMTVIGNNQASTYNNGAFFNCTLSGGASAGISRIAVRDVELRNFKANWWISIQNVNATHDISHVRISNIRAISAAGNMQSTTLTGEAAAVISIDGDTGFIRDVIIDGLYAEASYIKSGIVVYDRVIDMVIRDCTIYNAGLNAVDDSASYAVQLYDQTPGLMNSIAVVNLNVRGVRDNGVYVANGDRISIINPKISGQTSTADGSLPKGAISLVATTRFSVIGGEFLDNKIDINVIASSATLPSGKIVGISTKGADRMSIKVAPLGDDSFGLLIDGCKIDSDDDGIVFFQDVATWISDVEISNSTILGRGTYGIDVFALASATSMNRLTISNCRISGDNVCMQVRDISGRVIVRDVDVFGITNTVVGAQFFQCGNLYVNGLRIWDMPAGVGLDTRGITGKLENISFSAVTNPLQAGSLGIALPGSAVYDPANLADGAGVTTTVTSTGAALGDFAEASFSLDLQGITLTADVSAADTVAVRFQNETGGAIDLGSGTLRVMVSKP